MTNPFLTGHCDHRVAIAGTDSACPDVSTQGAIDETFHDQISIRHGTTEEWIGKLTGSLPPSTTIPN